MRRLGAAALLLLTSCTNGGGGAATDEVTIVVSAPLSSSPWVAESVVRGTRLAVDELNAKGAKYRVVELDHGNNVERAQANARRAVDEHAAALITDGVGAVAVAGVTGPANVPTFVTFEGGEGIVDEEARPALFRMAPANRPMTVRLTDYLAGKRPHLAVITDDSGYGRDARDDLKRALAQNDLDVRAELQVATGADPAPQVLAARQSGADTILVWARAPVLASVISAVRSRGWDAPIWSGPTAEDPVVRQQLAQHPEWLNGVGFVSFRMTAEIGPEPFTAFRAAYEKAFGPQKVGVSDGGREVVQPPDWAMYGYDSVKLVHEALRLTKGERGRPLVDMLRGHASITGANGDERSFVPTNHEGVSPDDMYIALFQRMRYKPAKDDLLSASLPEVPQ